MTRLVHRVLHSPQSYATPFAVVALALALLALSGAGDASGRSTAADPPTLYVAVGGSDKGLCTKAAPCASFGRAFALAAPGADVEVASGSYPLQVLTSAGKGGGVVFRPAAGASVTLAEFVSGDSKTRVGARGFELRDFKVSSYVRLRWGSEDVTLRNLDAGGLNLTSVSRVQVLGGDYGPMADGVSHINACGVPGCTAAEDVLIDGAQFHDYTVTDPAKHSECLMIWPGRRVTIRNSTFRNCTDFDVLVKPYNTGMAGLPGQITFENNFLDEPIVGDGCFCQRGGNAIAITQGGGESWGDVRIRYNSSLGGIRVDPAVKDVVVKGNIARKDTNYSCQTNISYSYNIWSGAKCSPTDRTAPFSSTFVNATPGAFDLHLLSRARAIGAGDPRSAPRTDIDGRLRPTRLSADAGASQREPVLVSSGRSIGNATIRAGRDEVVAAYGAPRAKSRAFDAYRVRAGWLRVRYRQGRVVEIATTSPYYETRQSLGPGVRVSASKRSSCRRVGKSGLYLRTTRGAPARVAELIVTAPGYTPSCAKPSRR